MVLQFAGSAIRLGPFSVSLVLIPIVLGAALYGWGMEVLLSGTAQLPDIRLRIPGSGDLRPDGGESPQRRPI